MWARPYQSFTIRAPLSVRNRDREGKRGRRKPTHAMVQHSTLDPRRDLFSASLPRPWRADGKCVPSKTWTGEGGDGGSEGRGQAGEISHIILAEAGRSLVPPMRAFPSPHVPNPDPNPPGYCCVKHGRKYSFAGTAFSSAFRRRASPRNDEAILNK